MRRRNCHYYRSNLFACTDRTAFNYLCLRWGLLYRTSLGLVCFTGNGVPRRGRDQTDPLPHEFWVQLRRTLAPGSAVVVHQAIGDRSGVTLSYRILTSDGEHEVIQYNALPYRFSLDEWEESYPDEPYPYTDPEILALEGIEPEPEDEPEDQPDMEGVDWEADPAALQEIQIQHTREAAK